MASTSAGATRDRHDSQQPGAVAESCAVPTSAAATTSMSSTKAADSHSDRTTATSRR